MDINMLSGYTPAQLLPHVIGIAAQASIAILDVYNSDFSIAHKDDDSPLTAADIASHNTICKGLNALTPDVPILSEESASLPWDIRKYWHSYWLVDPLDGTREFIKRNGEFTVNIALIQAHKPVLGVVHVPVSNTCYFAAINDGAYKTDGTATQRIHTRNSTDGNFIIAGSRSHGNDLQKRFIEQLGPETETIIIGSSLKFCLVAEGKVDLYPRFGPTSEWDSAAAQCVVEQAGGTVTDLQFMPIRYNTKESLLNPDFLVIANPQFDWKSRLDKVNR
jgi:3'(2'), 5'-bisphosphate nucleotidase